MQSPNQHMYYGCFKCNNIGAYCNSWFINDERRNKKSKLYLIEFISPTEHFYKIGITVGKRFGKKYRNYKINTLLEITGGLFDMFNIEQYILNEFVSKQQYSPKNFCDNKHGKTECFSVEREQIIELINIIKNKYNEDK